MSEPAWTVLEDDESIPVEVMTHESLVAAGYSESDAAFRMAIANGDVGGCCGEPSVTADELRTIMANAPAREMRLDDETWAKLKAARVRLFDGEADEW